MDFDVKEMTCDDLSQVVDIYVRAYGGSNWNEVWTNDLASIRLHELLENPHCKGYSCFLGNRLVGGVICETLTWCVGRQMEIKELFVDPSFQHHGVGRTLVNSLKSNMDKENVSELLLWTNKCPSLIGFYSNLGFRQDHDTTRFVL